MKTLGYELTLETEPGGLVRKMKVSGNEPGVGIGSVTLLGREFHRIGDR